MNLYIQSVKWDLAGGKHWPAQNREVLEMLGVATSRLPKEGLEPRLVQGIKVWVKPAYPKLEGVPLRDQRKESRHRIMVECPACKKEMSLGRLHQHSRIHKEEANHG